MTAATRDAGVGRFVQESFAPIYEDGGDEWIGEDAPLHPVRTNRSVLDAERAVHQFTEAGGVGIVLRFASFDGPDSQQLGQMVSFVRHGWGPLPGPPQSFVSCASHDDAATAVAIALGLPAGTYNVADDEPLRHRDFVDTLARAVGAAPPRLPPAWLTRIGGSLARMYARSLRISNMKLRGQGWAPRYPSARDGLPPAIAALAVRLTRLLRRDEVVADLAGRRIDVHEVKRVRLDAIARVGRVALVVRRGEDGARRRIRAAAHRGRRARVDQAADAGGPHRRTGGRGVGWSGRERRRIPVAAANGSRQSTGRLKRSVPDWGCWSRTSCPH